MARTLTQPCCRIWEQWPPPCEIREALFSSQEPPCLQEFLGETKAGWVWVTLGWQEHGVAEGPTAGGMQTEEVPWRTSGPVRPKWPT